MNFFKARVDIEKAGTREVVPLWEYNIDAENAQSQLVSSHLPVQPPAFSKLLITGPLTDVLEDGNAIGGTGFIVSNTLRDILSAFNIGRHAFYPLESFDYVSRNRIQGQYFWLQLIDFDFYPLIDYTQSKFVLYDDFEEENISELEIESPGGLMAAVESTREKDISVLYTKLVFNSKFQANPLDIFYMNGISDNIFSYPIFSERLKNKLIGRGLTGFEFKEVPLH
ncbi:hypothetical protein FNT36_14930 [Hymenobacter setariae]|uniref:Immunity MXAN-0049 protein domain-containing protein n=1 Tax=Hymenobacter setariae TaxID=2594794 RepID=A0A558BR16_9BACT|nr:hypothetical protein [Hymenobacter setariae]TVT38964.1 hypothetical protein FNT36_14930 [Hymenobacter setariae]